jgi:hypothetical protein
MMDKGLLIWQKVFAAIIWCAHEKDCLSKTIKLLKECQQKVNILNLDSSYFTLKTNWKKGKGKSFF